MKFLNILQKKQLQSELWNLSQQEYYNEKKGLPKHMIKQIKKMKIGKVHKACSICHSDFVKGKKIFLFFL